MEFSSDLSWLGISLQIFFTDILLAGDNAVIIAAACCLLPRRLVPRAIAVGAIGAVILRVLLAVVANVLMAVPLLKALGGIMLALFAINLKANAQALGAAGASENLEGEPDLESDVDFMGAALFILLADTIMSLDNVVAISAISDGNFVYLVLGLVLSVPFVFFGSFLLTEAIAQYPEVVTIGSALLGWVSGSLIVNDALWSDWVHAHVEALGLFAPLGMAIFVVAEGAITGRYRAPALPQLNLSMPRLMREAHPIPAIPAAPVAVPISVPAPIAPQAAVPEPAVVGHVRPETPPVAAIAAEPQEPVVIFEPPASSSAGPSDKVVLIGLLALFAMVGAVLVIAIAMAPANQG